MYNGRKWPFIQNIFVSNVGMNQPVGWENAPNVVPGIHWWKLL